MYDIISNILRGCVTLSDYQVLFVGLQDVIDSIGEYDDDIDITTKVNAIIYKHVVDNLLSGIGIAVDSDADIGPEFILGAVNLLNIIRTDDVVIANDVLGILNRDDSDDYLKLGELLQLSNDSFYAYDVYELLSFPPTHAISLITESVERVIESSNYDPYEAVDVISVLNSMATELLNTNLLTAAARDNKYRLDTNDVVRSVDSLTGELELDDMSIVRELVTGAVMSGNDKAWVVDILDTLYNDRNTVNMVDYLNELWR